MPSLDVSHAVVALIAALATLLFVRSGRARSETSTIRRRMTSDTSDAQEEPPKIKGAARIFALLFLIGWIAAWSAGIFMAFSIFVSAMAQGELGFVTVFIGGWLIAALAGWLFAAKAIVDVTRGRAPGKKFGG